MFPQFPKSRGFTKGCWFPQHKENTDDRIEFVDGAIKLEAKSLFSWNFKGRKPLYGCFREHYLTLIIPLSFYSKDVRLPVQLQRAMAAEAEAAREARAKVCSTDMTFYFYNIFTFS